jgi:hypothetical protein
MALTVDDIFAKYPIVLTRHNAGWKARIPELSLACRDDAVDTVVRKLREKAATLLEELREAEALDELPEPQSRKGNATQVAVAPWWDIRGFALRSVLIVAIFAIALGITVGGIQRALNSTVDKLDAAVAHRVEATFGGLKPKAFWKHIDAELARYADPKSDLPPEKQAQLVAEIRAVVNRIKPFTNELAPLFEGSPAEIRDKLLER